MATVLVTDEQHDHPVEARRWVALATSVLQAEGVPEHAELSMAFVDEETMADLNRRYAGEDGATDVLAFPIDDIVPGETAPAMLGDLVICPAVARRNAAPSARAYDDELALLVVHGILHLVGMDHAEAGEAADMHRRERELLGPSHTANAARH
ncbi:MAG: rRNA maturation RNase YbeY [Actinomycetota bacterium]|nr:rRNA maturation RNase YbeY [Actinomycetota bacterium]MDQ3575219.1 rRNA maturation RNase YbeY [Actinomycetota bacterium]